MHGDIGPLGYGRDADGDIACPRSKSDLTPCSARDGQFAGQSDGTCNGCGAVIADLLAELVNEVAG